MTIMTIPGTGRIIIPGSMANPATKVKGAINLLFDPDYRKSLGLAVAPFGGTSPTGFHTGADVITQTTDGVSTADLWAEFQTVLAAYNARRTAVVDLLTYTVANPVVTVPQVGGLANFEKASEFGVPVAQRTGVGFFQMGFDFDWYDTGARYTWMFLSEASADQIQSIFTAIVEADNRLVFNEVMRTMYSNVDRTATITGNNYTVYAFYNADGTVPPTYGTTTFNSSHTHYAISGGATVDSGDLDQMQDDLASHGYDATNGYQLLILANKQETAVMRTFKSAVNGGTSRWDFIPAQGTPNWLLPVQLMTNQNGVPQPPNTYRGIKVVGQYGDALILENDYFAPGYVITTATGGPENVLNPIGIREHARTDLRGLRMVKGRSDDYPLQDSYWQRGFGTGVRYRGATYVMKIAATGSYAPPAQYT